MPATTIALRLNDRQRSALERAYKRWDRDHHRDLEFFAYTVFRPKAGEYRKMVSKFETDGSETRQIPEKWNEPTSRRKDVTLTPADIDWETQRATPYVREGEPPEEGEEAAEDGGPLVTVRFPSAVLDRLERGLALRQAWSLMYGKDAPVKLYETFEEWAIEILMEHVTREVGRIEDDEATADEEELYPGIDEKKPPAPPPRPMIQPAQNAPPRGGVDPHDPHRRRPWDR